MPGFANPPPINSPPIIQVKTHGSGVLIASGDYYPDLYALKANLELGKDYTIVTENRGSVVTVAAPHGGNIEPGTSELARAIADKDFNLFDFVFLRSSHRRRGHVTATNFRDASLARMLAKSRICVAVHRMKDTHKKIYIGGRNQMLKRLAAEHLLAVGFCVEEDPPRLKGTSKRNFVNLTSEQGLQLEIPIPVANQLMPDIDSYAEASPVYKLKDERTEYFNAFVGAIRATIEVYLEKTRTLEDRQNDL
ncbi:MAG: poly-gamma-glutamate hydrolase family protein [Candidatus Obscuribacterales bacterium]|nr:poly-gamma-glutamate hydrolase family protein [Candidatus Obscuribacterales bacterium]